MGLLGPEEPLRLPRIGAQEDSDLGLHMFMGIEKVLLVCYGSGVVLRMVWMAERDQDFAMNHSELNHTPDS